MYANNCDWEVSMRLANRKVIQMESRGNTIDSDQI